LNDAVILRILRCLSRYLQQVAIGKALEFRGTKSPFEVRILNSLLYHIFEGLGETDFARLTTYVVGTNVVHEGIIAFLKYAKPTPSTLKLAICTCD